MKGDVIAKITPIEVELLRKAHATERYTDRIYMVLMFEARSCKLSLREQEENIIPLLQPRFASKHESLGMEKLIKKLACCEKKHGYKTTFYHIYKDHWKLLLQFQLLQEKQPASTLLSAHATVGNGMEHLCAPPSFS